MSGAVNGDFRRLAATGKVQHAIVASAFLVLTAFGPACSTSTWSERANSALADVSGEDSPAERLQAGELALLVRGQLAVAKRWSSTVLDDASATASQRARAGLTLAYIGATAGDPELVARSVVRALAFAQPRDAELMISLTRAVWGNLKSATLEKELRQAVGAIAQKNGASWQPARAAAQRVSRSLSRLDKDAQAQAQTYERTGVVRTWRLSAPWGLSPSADATRVLGPERRPLQSSERVGSGWAKRPRKTWTLSFSDGELGFPEMASEPGVGFAEHWLTTQPQAVDRRVVFELETNRDVSLWVNTTKVIHIDALARRQRGFRRVGVTLPAGSSRLLVKLSTTRSGGFAKLTMSSLSSPEVFGPSGVLKRPDADAVALANGPLPAVPVPVFAPPPSAFDSPAKLKPLVAGDSATAVKRLLVASALAARPYRDADGAADHLATLDQALPTFPGVALARARVLSSDPALGRAQSRGQRRTALEAVKAQWPGNVPALRKLAKLEIADGRFDEGLALLRAALSKAPDDLATRLAEVLLYQQRGWEAEAVRAASALSRLGQRSPRILQEIVDVYRHFGRSLEATRALERLESAFPQQAVVRRARWAGDRGNLKLRAELLIKHWSRHPERFSLARRAVRALRAAGETVAAGALVGRMLSARPEEPWALAERVNLALDRGDESGRRRALDRALALQPNQLQLAELRSWLTGKPSAESQTTDSKALIAAYRARLTKEASTGPEAGLARYPVVTLLDRSVIDVGADGYSRALTHVVRVVQSKAGADKLGELRPPRDAELLVVRSIKPDGRVLWPERVAGKPDLSFKGLAPGDVVEWAWIRRGDVKPDEGGYITGLSFAFWGVPTLRKEVDVSVSPKFTLAQHVRNGAPSPKVETLKGTTSERSRTLYRWAVDELPALQREPLAANARLFFPYIDLTVWPSDAQGPTRTDRAWRAIARGYKARLDRLTQPGPRATATAMAARKRSGGRPGSSALWAAFDFVKEEINHTERFNTFDLSAEQGLAGQKGNRNVVLVAVAKALGSSADIVLCAPRQHGVPVDAAHPLPNANRFWYPVVRIAGKSPADVLFADPSRPYNPFGVLPRAMYGARCLDLAAAAQESSTVATAFTSLPAYDRYEGTALGWTFDITLDVDASGAAQGKLVGTGFGPVASGLRHVYLNADERRREQIWQQWTASVIKGARLTDWDVSDEVDADQPVTWTLHFSVGQFAKTDGKSLTINTLSASMFANYLGSVPTLEQLGSMPRRQTPLALAPHYEDVRIRVRFAGPGGRLRASLKAVDVDTPEFGAHQQVSVNGNTLTVERSLTIGPGRIAPADYPTFRKHLIKVVQGMSQGVTLER